MAVRAVAAPSAVSLLSATHPFLAAARLVLPPRADRARRRTNRAWHLGPFALKAGKH